MDQDQIAWSLAAELHDFDFMPPPEVGRLIETVLSFPRREYDFLGSAVARCVDADKASDVLLWRFIDGDIGYDAILQFHFGNKLHCNAHDFDGQDFLPKRSDCSI